MQQCGRCYTGGVSKRWGRGAPDGDRRTRLWEREELSSCPKITGFGFDARDAWPTVLPPWRTLTITLCVLSHPAQL